MILILRASHANEFELQNYSPLRSKFDIRVVTSRHPLTPLTLPAIQLWSPTDLPAFPLRRPLLNRLLGGEQWLVGLERLIRPTDIVHTTETYTPYTHQAVELRKQGRIKRLICTCWETIPHNNEKLARLRQWKEEAYQYVDIFHTPTIRAKQALIKEGVDTKKIIVIPYGVDLSQFEPRKGSNKHHKKPVILTVARQVPEKGYHLWQQLSRSMSDIAEFRWVSDVAYQAMPQIYQQADIFLLPSLATSTWEEQYGMTLVEAMASGLAIVTTATGAIPEVVAGAGLIALPTYPSLSSVIQTLLDSPARIARLGQLAHRRALRRYSHLSSAKALAKLYD